MRKLLIALLCMLVLAGGVFAAVAAWSAGGTRRVTIPGPPLPAAVTIQGNVTVPADSVNSQDFRGGDCTSAAGYDDIAGGVEIAVTSPSGVVIKTGTLNGGHTSATYAEDGSIIAGTASECSYHFLIDGIDGGLDRYGVTVGNASRGTVHYTPDQLGQSIDIRIG